MTPLYKELPEMQRCYWAQSFWTEIIVAGLGFLGYAVLLNQVSGDYDWRQFVGLDLFTHACIWTALSLGAFGCVRLGVSFWREGRDYTWEQQRLLGHEPVRFLFGRWLGNTAVLWLIHVPMLLGFAVFSGGDLAENMTKMLGILTACTTGHLICIGICCHEVSFNDKPDKINTVLSGILISICVALSLTTGSSVLDISARREIETLTGLYWYGLSIGGLPFWIACSLWIALLAYTSAIERLGFVLMMHLRSRMPLACMATGLAIACGFAFAPQGAGLQSWALIVSFGLIGMMQINLAGRERRGPVNLTRFWAKWARNTSDEARLALMPDWVIGLVLYTLACLIMLPGLVILHYQAGAGLANVMLLGALACLLAFRNGLASAAASYMPLMGDEPLIYRPKAGPWRSALSWLDGVFLVMWFGLFITVSINPSWLVDLMLAPNTQPSSISSILANRVFRWGLSGLSLIWGFLGVGFAIANLRDIYQRELQLVAWAQDVRRSGKKAHPAA
ncbi:MAG: hypothetical protein Alpg2KO_11600 [Alphaproteobacteria bacterium]